jgi:hypothetical protein
MDDAHDTFRWPDKPYPPPNWWEVAGAELGLEPDQIRFCAALINLGGIDSRNNSAAARLAGLNLSRTEAFRLARSVKVRRLITAAEDQRSGRAPAITEDEINQRIDRMIRSQNDQWAARGIELHEKRLERRRQKAEAQPDLNAELRSLAAISVDLARAYAAEKNVPYPPLETPPHHMGGNGFDKEEADHVAD